VAVPSVNLGWMHRSYFIRWHFSFSRWLVWRWLKFRIFCYVAPCSHVEVGHRFRGVMNHHLIFCDVAPCRLVEIDRSFRGSYRLHHQGILIPSLHSDPIHPDCAIENWSINFLQCSVMSNMLLWFIFTMMIKFICRPNSEMKRKVNGIY
jgi:hypothetical protein